MEIIGGLILLILGGNWLLKSAVALSIKLEIPKIIIAIIPNTLVGATGVPNISRPKIDDHTSCEYWKLATKERLESWIA